MATKYEYVQKVDILKLKLDAENPRFASSILVKENGKKISQDEIRKHLLKYSNVIELANRIKGVGELHGGELISCCRTDGIENEYIVLEGNRRACACQLLLNRDLIPPEYKNKIPTIEEDVKENIRHVQITLYSDRNSIQAYLSDRHINSVKTWSPLEKNNFYMNLFQQYGDIESIQKHTPDKETKIAEAIKKYKFFMDIFNLIKLDHPQIEIENLDYLPLVDTLGKILISNDPDVGLNLEFDKSKLIYVPKSEKKEIYQQILKLVGEAFLIRTEKEGNLSKITSTGIKNKAEQKKLIVENVRIPGLYDLIKQYKRIDTDADKPDGGKETTDAGKPNGDKGTTGPTPEKSKTKLVPAEIELNQYQIKIKIPSNQIELENWVKVFKNSSKEDVAPSELEIKVNNKICETHILPTYNEEKKLDVEYTYNDTKTGLISKKCTITFYDGTKINMAANDEKDNIFYLAVNKGYNINFDPVVNRLINQLMNLGE